LTFKYSCFISYSHVHGQQLNPVVPTLHDALKSELSLWFDEDIFMDKERLEGGDFWHPKLVDALCHSPCMVVLLTPVYFNDRHIYCAREFRAMELLEEQRLTQLGGSVRTQGLIIPVVCRGAEFLPPGVKTRQLHNFEEMLLTSRPQDNPAFIQKVNRIARYIRSRYEELIKLSDPCANCSSFEFPDEAEARHWLQGIRTSRTGQTVPSRPAPFPDREDT
jgi:hypothetical protein